MTTKASWICTSRSWSTALVPDRLEVQAHHHARSVDAWPGLPGNCPLLPSDPTLRHRAAYAPGEHFHYCNLGYEALGQLAWIARWSLSCPKSFRKRILEPLGMTQSEPVITLDIRGSLGEELLAVPGRSPECARRSTWPKLKA